MQDEDDRESLGRWAGKGYRAAILGNALVLELALQTPEEDQAGDKDPMARTMHVLLDRPTVQHLSQTLLKFLAATGGAGGAGPH